MAWFGKDDDNNMGHDFQPGSLEATMHWQVIWPRAIALAWTDKKFHKALKKDPRKAISETFGYHLMDDLDLVIEDAPGDAVFDYAKSVKSDAGPSDPWAKLPNLKLVLSIPPAPEASLQAVAITAYQDTGRTYPFTCC